MQSLPQQGIAYLFNQPPEPGEARRIADGLFWVRLPLPLALDHVNVWVADDGDGWTIVDCGLDTEQARLIWDAVQKNHLYGRKIRRLVATHGHPDHIGMARRIVGEQSAPFVATMIEWENAIRARAEVNQDIPKAQVEFLVRHGYSEESAARRSGFGRTMAPLMPDPPPLDETFADAQIIRFGQRDWRVIIAGGHAPEHASFYCEADRILIAGDQILPRITPFIGVHYRGPEDDPLHTYLDSLDLFDSLDPETIVLPGHGLPFRGLPLRLDELREHHDHRLSKIVDGLHRPKHAFDVARDLFPKAIGTGHERLAMAESIAHLNFLMHRGRVERVRDRDGTLLFGRG